MDNNAVLVAQNTVIYISIYQGLKVALNSAAFRRSHRRIRHPQFCFPPCLDSAECTVFLFLDILLRFC